MMKRVWLFLADTLVIGLLLFSFVLLFLSKPPHRPSTSVPAVPKEQIQIEAKPTSVLPEENTTLLTDVMLDMLPPISNKGPSLEALLQASKEVTMQEYTQTEDLSSVSLSKRLRTLNAHKGAPVYIRIFKKEALLEVWIKRDEGYAHLKDYPICAYSGHLGPKLKEGDKQAPEGFYRVRKRQLNPHSRFHLAFNLGYPNAYDRAHHRTGSYLMVHGKCASIGCYAMTDRRIDEIYALVEAALNHGQPYVPVHIFPFRMEDAQMDAHSESRWYDFWMELKEGYDYFEAEERPPHVEVKNGHYVVLEADD